MISLTKLLTDDTYFGDDLRYRHSSEENKNGVSHGRGPVVVWNSTRKCNLKCMHCYSNSSNQAYKNELTSEEALKFIDELGDFKVPVLLFSGGEPLIRKDFFQLAERAVKNGIRPTLSTNGTLITPETAKKIKEIGVGYVGISLDGLQETNDRFRGTEGAFQLALNGIRNCISTGQRVGLRFTINKHNTDDINNILDLMEQENIDRICFYHLVYSGRGSKMINEDISREQTRAIMDTIIERTMDFNKRGLKKEILMVDNHADAVYIYLKMKEEDPKRAEIILKLLMTNGGNRTGIAFANVDNLGNVHPDQFTQHHTFGNVKERAFGDIWSDTGNPVMAGLKDRKKLLKGRCAVCRWLNVCNGNFRARAEAVTGDFWGSDPACYLTDPEIGLA